MIKLSYIQEYVVLAETLNYTKAAEKLYTAQPAISRKYWLMVMHFCKYAHIPIR